MDIGLYLLIWMMLGALVGFVVALWLSRRFLASARSRRGMALAETSASASWGDSKPPRSRLELHQV